MSVKSQSARLAVVAKFVDRFADRLDPAIITAKQRLSATAELDRLISLFSGQSAELESALIELRKRLGTRPQASVIAARSRSTHRGLAMLLRLLPPLATALTVSAFTASPAMAALPVYSVGGSIVYPETGATETVSQLLDNYAVVTSAGHWILLAQTVGDSYTVTDQSTTPATVTTYSVTAVTTTSGRVTGVTIKNLTTNATSTVATYSNYSGPPPAGGGTGSGVTYATPSTPGVA